MPQSFFQSWAVKSGSVISHPYFSCWQSAWNEGRGAGWSWVTACSEAGTNHLLPGSLHTHTVNHFCHTHLQPTTQASQQRRRGNRSRTRSEETTRARSQRCKNSDKHIALKIHLYTFNDLFNHYFLLACQLIRQEIVVEDTDGGWCKKYLSIHQLTSQK